ncbi:MAG TPA: Gfo/Idh/MocA family oxidoreductase [Propionibacteriaceae bacterium]|jgi:predicted dehydrogenase|nr:Gfo/Idh/MocA family oxidoreductase [Propionibacteriaceae bacterium]
MSQAEPVRLIQVGAGLMGRHWLDVIGQSTDVRLVGLADLDLPTAQRAAAGAGFADVEVASSLAELLDRLEADAVINVTIPEAHAEVSTTALLNGLAVLCEKPLADTLPAALSMIAAAEAGGRLLMVSQSRRYWRNLEGLRGQIARLGRLGLVACSVFKSPHFGGFRDQMAYPLLKDMAIHQFDLARDLIGSEPVWISCESFNPDWSWYAGDAAAEVNAEFADGTRFMFTGSWCSPGLETSWNGSWRISGASGTALWDGDHAPIAQIADGTPIPAVVGTGPEEIAGSLAEFVTALRDGSVPYGEAHSNVLSLAMVEGAIRSAQTRRRIVLGDLLDDAYRQALAAEQRPELAAALASWASVHEVIGNARRAVPAGELKGELK